MLETKYIISLVGGLIVFYIFYKDVLLEEGLLSKLILGDSNNNFDKYEEKIDRIIKDYTSNHDTIVTINNEKIDLEGILFLVKSTVLENDKLRIKEIMDKIVEKYGFDTLRKIGPTIVKMVATNNNFREEDITFIGVSILHYGQH